MNYYEHHLGDYAQATAHLSFVEDAAYSRLIRKYYAEEKPLPTDLKAVQRLVGARTEEEKAAVEIVLQEFFTLQEDGWHNNRCDQEIARYREKQDKARRSAEARWNKAQQHSEGNANAMRTHSEGNALQTPDTSHQTPDTIKPPKAPKARGSAIVAETMPLPPELPREVWRDWVQYRSEIRKPLTERAADLQIRELCKLISKGQSPVAIIEQSIRNQWTGLFELKGQRNQAESFYERDQRLKRERWEEMTGRKWPEQPGSIIEMDEADIKALGMQP